MVPIDLYIHWVSSPCRAVIMACNVGNIENKTHFIDIFKMEQMEENFLKINPDHTLPTIVDNGFNLWESKAIGVYLVDKYAPDSTLFPKDLQKRAVIHRLMELDNSVYKAICEYVIPLVFKNGESKMEEMEKMFQRLNDTVFHDKSYATGEVMTLADLYLISSCTFTEVTGYYISEDKFPKLGAWVKRMKESAFYKATNVEFEKFKPVIQEMMDK